MLSDKSIERPSLPTYMERLHQKLCKRFSANRRRALNEALVERLGDKDFTIICSNCAAGVFYHDLGKQFLTPTVNMAFDGEDFCKFCEDLERYLAMELVGYITDEVPYPVGHLEDVELRFVHYKSFSEAKEKWDSRKQRVRWDKLLIMATDRDGMGKPENMQRFDKLPYPKLMYTARKYPEYPWAVYCPCFSRRPEVGVITGVADMSGLRFYEKYVDLASIIQKL